MPPWRCSPACKTDQGDEDVQGNTDREGRRRLPRCGEGHRRGAVARGRRDGARRAFVAELQGRPGDHRQGPGGAQIPDGAGHRYCRYGRGQRQPGLQGRRPRGAQRLGCRRNALGRPGPEGAPEGRLAGAAAGCFHGAAGRGHRHRRLYRHAVRAGAGEAWRQAGRRRDRRHRGGGRRGQRGDCRAQQAGLHGGRRQRPAGRSGLPEAVGGERSAGAQRLLGTRQAARQGALGGGGGCGG